MAKKILETPSTLKPEPRKGLPLWLKILGGLAGLLVVAALAAPYFIPWDKVKAKVVAQGSQALGRPLSIGSIDLGLFTGIHVKDVRLANAGGGFSDAPLFNNVDAKVSLSVLSLLSGRLVIDSIRFEKPSVLLETDRDGRSNLQGLGGGAPAPKAKDGAKAKAPATAAAPSGAASASFPVVVNEFIIEQGEVVVRDRRAGTETAIHGLDIKLTGLSLAAAGASRLEVGLVAELQGRKIPVSFRSDFRLDLPGSAVEIHDGVLTLPGLTANLKGAVKDLAQPDLDLQADVSVDAAKAQAMMPPSTDANGQPQDPKLGGSLALKMAVKGPLSRPKDLVVDADADSAGLSAQGLKTGKLSLRLKLRALKLDADAQMDFYKGHLSAQANADLGQTEPAYACTAALKGTDFGPLVDDLAAGRPQSRLWQQLKGKASGTFDLQASLKGKGLKEPALTQGRQGSAQFDLKDGMISKTDLQEQLASAIPDPATQAALRNDIKFSHAIGTVLIQGPKTTLKSFQLGSGAQWRDGQLYLEANGTQVSGGPVDFHVIPHLNPAQVQVGGDLGKALQDDHGWPTFDYIAYAGPTAAQAKADFTAGLKKAATKAISDKAQQLLQDKAGNALKQLPGLNKLFGR